MAHLALCQKKPMIQSIANPLDHRANHVKINDDSIICRHTADLHRYHIIMAVQSLALAHIDKEMSGGKRVFPSKYPYSCLMSHTV